MVTRSDVLEKFFGRRVVSCLGWCLLIFVALLIAVLVYSYFKGRSNDQHELPPPHLPHGMIIENAP